MNEPPDQQRKWNRLTPEAKNIYENLMQEFNTNQKARNEINRNVIIKGGVFTNNYLTNMILGTEATIPFRVVKTFLENFKNLVKVPNDKMELPIDVARRKNRPDLEDLFRYSMIKLDQDTQKMADELIDQESKQVNQPQEKQRLKLEKERLKLEKERLKLEKEKIKLQEENLMKSGQHNFNEYVSNVQPFVKHGEHFNRLLTHNKTRRTNKSFNPRADPFIPKDPLLKILPRHPYDFDPDKYQLPPELKFGTKRSSVLKRLLMDLQKVI